MTVPSAFTRAVPLAGFGGSTILSVVGSSAPSGSLSLASTSTTTESPAGWGDATYAAPSPAPAQLVGWRRWICLVSRRGGLRFQRCRVPLWTLRSPAGSGNLPCCVGTILRPARRPVVLKVRFAPIHDCCAGARRGARQGRGTVGSRYRIRSSYLREILMRENVLRNLASRAATDSNFLRQARQDLQGALAQHGYRLTDEEARLVEDLRRRTASMTDEELARALVSGLEGRSGSSPARPVAPNWRGSEPARPSRPWT